MKTVWRSIFAVIVAGSLLLISGVPSDAARRVARGSSYDGTWSVAIYTLRGGTVALFVLLYGSSAAACLPGREATKLTVPLEPGAQSA
jgi:uncharacterized membrane protein HdeD (DUF308 family)